MELMVVVLLIIILGTLATIGVRKYILAAKTTEATEMIGGIKRAQERHMSDTLEYLDVSGVNKLDDYSTYYHATVPLKRSKMAWGGGTGPVANAWRELGIRTTNPVMYIYGCAAGGGTVIPATPAAMSWRRTDRPPIGNYPTAATGQPWYLVQAAADLDGDGTVGTWGASSFMPEIFHDNDEE